MSVGIVSYGLGNIGSLALSLGRVGGNVEIVKNPDEAHKHSHLVIPGVGHYATAAHLIRAGGWDEVVISARDRGVSILGICLGMQLLLEGSGEAPEVSGLGLITGTVEHLLTQGCSSRVPHVGWNSVAAIQESILLGASEESFDFYFVHSYALAVPHSAVVGTTEYDVDFGSVVENENVFGVQFHPEKSSVSGRLLLSNFLRFQAC
jgi:glutamine amidotransferase